jgi:HEAT repeat protein
MVALWLLVVPLHAAEVNQDRMPLHAPSYGQPVINEVAGIQATVGADEQSYPEEQREIDALIAALRKITKNAPTYVVEPVCASLEPFGKSALPALLQAGKDSDWHVRWGVAEALGYIGPEAVPSLISMLKDARPGVQEGACFALAHLGPAAQKAIPALIGLMRKPWKPEPTITTYSSPGQALDKIGASALPFLVPLLTSRSAAVRTSAATVLETIGPAARRAIPALRRTLRDPDATVSLTAALALIAIHSPAPETISALIRVLRNQDSEMVMAAVQALETIGPAAHRVAPALLQSMNTSGLLEQQRAQVVEALGRVGMPTELLLQFLFAALDENTEYRYVATAAVGAFTAFGAKAVPALIAALQQSDSSTVIYILGGIGPPARKAVPALRRLLNHSDTGISLFVAQALWLISSDRAEILPILVRILREGTSNEIEADIGILAEMGDAARETLPVVIQSLHRLDLGHSDTAERAFLEMLKKIGVAAIPALLPMLNDQNTEIRYVALEGIGQIGIAAREALPGLLTALQDSDEKVRFAAAIALGSVGPDRPEVVAALNGALLDPLMRFGAVRPLRCKCLLRKRTRLCQI